MKRIYQMGAIVPAVAILLAGCGSSQAQGDASSTKAAALHYLQQVQPHVANINKEFSDQSSLIVQMSLKKVSYQTFKSAYDKNQQLLNNELKSVSGTAVDASGEEFKQQYVGLLTKGVNLMQDQENAMKQDGTMDKTQADKIKNELNAFMSQFQDLQKQYGVK